MEATKTSLTAQIAASVIAVVMAATGFAYTAQAASDVDALCQIASDLGISTPEFDALCADDSGDDASSTAGAGEYIHHSSIDFEFTRNLNIGDRGNDVMMLQKILNLDPATALAAGAGSAGQETEYYGQKSRTAVAKWQAKHGVSPALGNFYSLTRAEMNRKEEGGSTTNPTTPSGDVDGIEVSEGDNPDDALFPEGVIRFPVTAFEITAGDDDVDVETIVVRYNGDADEDDVIDSVVILDEDMNIIGDDENLDSDQEAEIDVDMTVEEGETVMLYVAVNARSGGTLFDDNDGLDFTMDVVEIEADADVDGLPVSGAEMTVQDNIDLGDIKVDVSHRNITLEIGSDDEEFVTVKIDANPDDTDDSVFVKSFRLENKGNGDLDDLSDIIVEVDNEEFDGDVDGDFVVFDFGDGFELEDGDSEDFEVRATVDGGATDKFQFVIDDESDVYAESEAGYGMPVKSTSVLVDGTNEVTISSGDADLSNNDDEESDEISVGSDIVIGYFDFDIEGEAITADELKLTIDVTAGEVTEGDYDELLLEDVRITDADGNTVVDSEDADWVGTAPTSGPVTQSMEVEFDNVEFPEGDHEGLMVLATISDEVADGSAYEIQNLDAALFQDVEGEDSEEDITIGGSSSFDKRTIEGAVLEISLEANTPSAADRDTTDDVDDFHMATIEFDARASGEDIEVDSFELDMTFAPSASSTSEEIEEMTNCRLYDEDSGDEVELDDEVEGEDGESGTTSNYDFTFESTYVVPSDENVKFELRCDLGDGLATGDIFTWAISGDEDVDAEGAVSGTEIAASAMQVGAAAPIEISTASVTAQRDSDAPDAQVVKFGQEVVLGILEVEADNGEATIEKVSFSLSNVNVIDDKEVFLYFEGSEEDSIELVSNGTAGEIDNLSINVEDGENIQLEFRGDASLSTVGATVLTVVSVTLDDGSTATLTTPAMNTVDVFEGVPVIELISDETNDDLDTANDVEVFEISIEADGEDVTVNQIVLDFDLANTVVSDARFEVFENSSHTNEAGTNNESTALASSISTDGDQTFAFASPITIPDGDTYYFVLIGDPTVSDDTRSVRVKLEDVAGAAKGVSFTAPTGLADSSVILEDDVEVLHRD